jgi:hypothetical protein
MGGEMMEKAEMRKHTKEPWCVIGVDNSYEIFSESEDYDVAWSIDSEANAERIVACVNACADVEDDCLEQGYVKWLQQRIVELELSVMNLEEEIARLKVIDNRLVTNGDWEDV